jgi:hypothetical protein
VDRAISLPQARIILWKEGMLSTLRQPQRCCSRSAPLQPSPLLHTRLHTTRLHQPATTTHTRDHTTNTSITLALSHDTPNAHQRATRDVTTHPLLAQQHHSAALPFASRQPLVLPAHLKTFILRPLLCTSRQKSPNPATTSDTATPGNAPDLISQDRIDDCASTGQSRPTRGGRRDAGG